MPDPAIAPAVPPAVVFKAGEYLFREGERPAALFVVESGQVELLRAFEGGPERLALLGAGDVVGEDCAFVRRAAGCAARAVIDSSVLRVPAADFLDLLRVRPEVAGHVIAAVGRRLLEARIACVIAAAEGEPAAGPAAMPAAPAAPPAGRPSAPSPAAAVARFVHADTGTSFPIPGTGECVVGRADPRTKFKPDVELSDVDSERSLSRRHAVITRRGTEFVLTEEGRVANGTFVNGQRVKAGEPTPIRDGDEVCFGLVRTVFRTT